MNVMLRRILALSAALIAFFFVESFLITIGYFDLFTTGTAFGIRLILMAAALFMIGFVIVMSWKNEMGDIGRIATAVLPVLAGTLFIVALMKPWLCESALTWSSRATSGQDCRLNGWMFDIACLEIVCLVLMLGVRRQRPRWRGEWLLLLGAALLTAAGFVMAALSEEPEMFMG